MQDKKQSGSYYTPEVLSTFLVNHVFNKYLYETTGLRILEPSCGDGEFVKPITLNLNDKDSCFDLIEIDKEELSKSLKKAEKILSNNQVNGFNQDFLKFKFEKTYSLIIGNPPYISKKHLSEEQIQICKEVCQSNISGEVKNIWPAFLIRSIQYLDENGIICFVLPSELLQVKYTSGIRKLILDSFDRVEVFAFNELIFEQAEQDVVAIIGIKNHLNLNEHGVSFYQVEKLEDLKIPNYTERNFNVHRERLDKWTNYILSDDELNGIDEISQEAVLFPIAHYCQRAEVGIVTAANNYFIRNKFDLEPYELNGYIKPILQKSNVINNTITITQNGFDALKNANKSVNMVFFDNVEKSKLSKGALRFIKEGEEEDLHKRYKMTKRTNWYHVPSVWSSEAIFCKRSHRFPRIFLNKANVLVTDSFYRVVTKEEYSPPNLVFSFYNTLTLTLAELEGRFYGGGVLELIPSEFKSLLIPYNDLITQEHYDQLESLFNKSASLNEILDFTDPILLPNIDNERIQKLRRIRECLYLRRTKTEKNGEVIDELVSL
ncbi:MAG: N-6 DNA methylase [Cyclobacteriaceae bacterium]